MSYSFSASGKTKAEALNNAKAELSKVAIGQPAHEIDRSQTETAIESSIDLLADDPSEPPISMSVSGSVTRDGNGEVHAVSLSINVYLG